MSAGASRFPSTGPASAGCGCFACGCICGNFGVGGSGAGAGIWWTAAGGGAGIGCVGALIEGRGGGGTEWLADTAGAAEITGDFMPVLLTILVLVVYEAEVYVLLYDCPVIG